MVLPEELITYVKEQLQQNVPIQVIIQDVKGKGYQISSSTLYKMRASIGISSSQVQSMAQSVPTDERNDNASVTTVFKQFDAIPQFAKDQQLTAGVDIQETKLVLKIHKNDEQVIGKQYKISIAVQDENFVTRVIQGVDHLLQNGSVNCVVVTSQYLVSDSRPRNLVFPNNLNVDLSQLMHHNNLYFVPRHHLAAMRYAKLFQKSVVYLQIDFENISSCKCEARTLFTQDLHIQHTATQKLPADQRDQHQICRINHKNCLLNFVCGKTVSNGIRDADIVAHYLAHLIFNCVMFESNNLFVLSGTMFSRLPNQVFTTIKTLFMKLYSGFSEPISPEGLIYSANQESAVMGAVIFAQQHIRPEAVYENLYSIGNLNQSPLPLMTPLNFNAISQSPAMQKQLFRPESQDELRESNASVPQNNIFSKLEQQTPINMLAGLLNEDHDMLVMKRPQLDNDDEL